MAGDKVNPSEVWGPNQYYGFIAPKRPDASTVGPGGNTVDRNRINDTVNTSDKNGTQSKPLGKQGTSGF